MGKISHESVETLEINRLEPANTKQGPRSSCGGLKVSIQSEEDAAQRKRRLHEYVARGPKMPQNENANYTSAWLEVQNLRYRTW